MCSMLCCLAGMDYGVPEDDDHNLAAIHAQFGHSTFVADAHYGIQATNALSTVLYTSVRSMQCISACWHACLDCSHVHAHKEEKEQSVED